MESKQCANSTCEMYVYYCLSLIEGERSHEKIWPLALGCWFSSQDSRRVFFFFSGHCLSPWIVSSYFSRFFFFLSSFNLNFSHLDNLLCGLVLMWIYIFYKFRTWPLWPLNNSPAGLLRLNYILILLKVYLGTISIFAITYLSMKIDFARNVN